MRVSDRWKQRVALNDLFEAYHASILEDKRQLTSTGDGRVPHTTGVLGSLLLSPGVLPGWNWARSATWASIPWHQNLLFEGGLRPTDDIIANFELFREREGLRLFNFQLHLLLSALVLIVQILLDQDVLAEEHLENLRRLQWKISLTLELLLYFSSLIGKITLCLVAILKGAAHWFDLHLKVGDFFG